VAIVFSTVPLRRMAQVCIHHDKNFSLRGERTPHNGGSQSEFCVILFDQPNWISGRQCPNHMSRCVGRIIIDKQDLAKRNSGRGNLRYDWRDIFGLV
jgi:hypothetical protein